MMIAMHNGRPQFRGAGQAARRHVERSVKNDRGWDRSVEWTDTGKAVVPLADGRRQFTGWEVLHVPHLRTVS